jgi:hypothetical protein
MRCGKPGKTLHVLAHGLIMLFDIAGRNEGFDGRAGDAALGNAGADAGAYLRSGPAFEFAVYGVLSFG